MWRKPEQEESEAERQSSISSRSPSPQPQVSVGDRATIGPSIAIKGDVTGEEDLIIQGRVEGKIDLKQHNVTVGKNGRVKADIYGRVLTVEGEVEGNLFGDEKIIVRQSGKVSGNISSPRVALEDGAQFKGNIDMAERGAGRSGAAEEQKKARGPAVETPRGNRPEPVKPPAREPVQESLRASAEKS